MPELPEVETITRALHPEIVGRTILGADIRWARTVATPSARLFRRNIVGQTVLDASRRGKFVHLQLSSSHLLIHLRMSGDLLVKPGSPAPEAHDRLLLLLSPQNRSAAAKPGPGWAGSEVSLVFNDTRKFGRVWLTQDPVSVIGGLGPEPLSTSFTSSRLYEDLRRHSRRLKPLLLDQTFLAGLGNIYTDEALHRAKLHPLALADRLSAHQAQRLYVAIRRTLREGIRRNGSSIDWVYRGGDYQNHFRVYDRTGKPCPVCGTRIKRLVVGQRGTHICPKCQRLPS
jgi:formamidopyrimidine-DNA glycosylase